MLSAFLTLANLWDITITVLFSDNSYIDLHIFSSLSTSIFEVASSNIYISGLVIIGLAKANLCFWPPDNNDPPSPTFVCNFSGKLCTKSYKLAYLSASFISLSFASNLPILKLSSIVPLNMYALWFINPTFLVNTSNGI